LAMHLMGNVEQTLTPRLGAEKAKEATRSLVMGVKPESESDLAGGVADLAAGRIDRARFLSLFGHRGSQEMELSQPRWSEAPETLERPASAAGHASAQEPLWQVWARLVAEARLAPEQRAALEVEVLTLHVYLGLRETAKHYLMYGYALIRRALVEL